MNVRSAETSALRRSMFEAALEVLPDVVLIHDDEFILFANAACRSVLAAETPEELEGQPIELIIHPDAFAAGRERRRLLLDGDRILKGIPLKIIALDGKTRHLTANAHPLVFRGVKVGMVVATPAAF